MSTQSPKLQGPAPCGRVFLPSPPSLCSLGLSGCPAGGVSPVHSLLIFSRFVTCGDFTECLFRSTCCLFSEPHRTCKRVLLAKGKQAVSVQPDWAVCSPPRKNASLKEQFTWQTSEEEHSESPKLNLLCSFRAEVLSCSHFFFPLFPLQVCAKEDGSDLFLLDGLAHPQPKSAFAMWREKLSQNQQWTDDPDVNLWLPKAQAQE